MTDYASLAAQFGGESVTDYGALAKKFGGQSEQVVADPKIGQPEELSFAEKYIAPAIQSIAADPSSSLYPLAKLMDNGGNMRGSAVGRTMQGLADPGVAVAQLGANAIGQGDTVNHGIAEHEKKYQAARAEAGSSGFDPARLAGNVAMTTLMGAAAPAVSTGPLRQAALAGASYGALTPITDGGESFWKDKAKETALGAATGPATSILGRMLARVVSPNASVNPNLKLLRDEGVQPTIGQSLGGAANAVEEKLTSLPIMGDRIAAMRNRAIDQFNNAAINRSVAPIGEKVQGIGQGAVAEAGDKLSDAYRNALKDVNHVNFDTPAFNQNLDQLQQMATGLTGGLDKKFERTLTDVVLRRMSPNGSILGTDLKAVDSELGKIAAKWQGSSAASEKEFGDAVLQLKSILSSEVGAVHPEVAKALKAADTGYANLVRVEGASKAGINNEGRFTPAQLNGAIRGADRSVRDRATARGEALMQDLGNAGNMLGNRVPDSGTVGRGLLAGVGLGAGTLNLGIPAGLIAGAAAYTPPVQNALAALISRRPADAPKISNYLRQLTQSGGVLTVPMVEQMREQMAR